MSSENPTLSADALRDLQALYDAWRRHVDRHSAALRDEGPMSLQVRTIGRRCDGAYSSLTSELVEQASALLTAAGEVDKLRAEIDEALQLTESCSSLKQMAAACIEGARLASTLPRPASGPAEAVAATVLPMDCVIAQIAAERYRQVAAEGWSLDHDDQHESGEIAGAAACYALTVVDHTAEMNRHIDTMIQQIWPWDISWWKPTTPRRNLIKAAALIVAEIERLDRAAPPAAGSTEGE